MLCNNERRLPSVCRSAAHVSSFNSRRPSVSRQGLRAASPEATTVLTWPSDRRRLDDARAGAAQAGRLRDEVAATYAARDRAWSPRWGMLGKVVG